MSRSPRTAKPKRLLALPLIGALGLVLADDPVAMADHHRWPGGPRDAGRVAETYDPLVVSLNETISAYLRGDLEVARTWLGFANAFLQNAQPTASSSSRWVASNADQLLVLLQLYDWYARGRHSELDAQHDAMVAWLYDLDSLNRSVEKPRSLGPSDVSYDLISHLVREIGDLQIDYDLITWQITELGPYRVDYDLITRMPQNIGDIEIDYDLRDRFPESIADVPIR